MVDNAARVGAPVIVEQNPVLRALFGSIEYQAEEDTLVTISRASALAACLAHGGFLMLHLRDLLTDELVWERLRRYLRSGRVQIEEPGASLMPMTAVSLEPEAVDAEVKIVLVGSVEQYYAVQEGDLTLPGTFAARWILPRAFCPPTTHAQTPPFSWPMYAAARPAAIYRRCSGTAARRCPPRRRRPNAPERHLCPLRNP